MPIFLCLIINGKPFMQVPTYLLALHNFRPLFNCPYYERVPSVGFKPGSSRVFLLEFGTLETILNHSFLTNHYTDETLFPYLFALKNNWLSLEKKLVPDVHASLT